MRILILGNMANDGYAVAKELRNMKKDVDLAINSSDFAMAFPEWEDGNIVGDIDPYSVHRNDIKNTWNPPGWIRYFDFLNRIPRRSHMIEKIKVRIDLIRMMREYDIVETHVPYCIYSQFSGVPYVVYDAGWIRYFPYHNDIRDKLAVRGYRKAINILFTNSDTLKIFKSLPYFATKEIIFTPFAIDPEKYRPMDTSSLREEYVKDDQLLLFCPARQIWHEKGNDKLFMAFAKFVKDYPKSKLVTVSWSVDKDRSIELVESLRITDNVIWINPMNKRKLIMHYNASDIVLDQFVLGGWGTSTPEAMSCGKPAITSWAGKDGEDRKYVVECFKEEPPIPSAYTVEEIYSALVDLARDEQNRIELGKRCREWVMKTHSPRLVATRHLQVLEQLN